jgi:hypothetical protein
VPEKITAVPLVDGGTNHRIEALQAILNALDIIGHKDPTARECWRARNISTALSYFHGGDYMNARAYARRSQLMIHSHLGPNAAVRRCHLSNEADFGLIVPPALNNSGDTHER